MTRQRRGKWVVYRERLLPGCICLLLLCACHPSGPDAAFEDYLTRLGRTLSVPSPAMKRDPPQRPPRLRELHRDIAPGNLDALDFLSLSGCALQTTIGRRNSSLGRMARDSQRLLLELEYLRLAPECIAYQRQRGDGPLAAALEQAWHKKRQQLPALIFNATLGSEEYRAFWRSPPPDADYPAETGSQVVSALQAINAGARRWLAGDYTADNREFEIRLSAVAAGDGGALLQALVQQDAWLGAADELLGLRMTRGSLCSRGHRSDAADILDNVVHKYFIGGIQPRAAAIGRRHHELLPPVAELEALLGDALPAAYRVWHRRRDAHIARLVQAPRRHVAQLQELQRDCAASRDGQGLLAATENPARHPL